MTSRPVVQGGVYLVPDKFIKLPPEEDQIVHVERRPVIVISGPNTNSFNGWPNVLAVPVSSSTGFRTLYCVKLNAGDGNLTKKGWARITAVQPLAKTRLEDHLGVVSGRRMEEIQARIVQYMGLPVEDLDEPVFDSQ